MSNWLTAPPEPDSVELASFKADVKKFAEADVYVVGGSRNEALNKLAYRGGKLIETDQVEEYYVYEVLIEAAEENGYQDDYGDAPRIIKAGIKAAIKEAPPVKNDNPIYNLILTADDLAKLPPMSWLIDDLIVENSIAVLVGDANIGKSFMAIDLAAHIATGKGKWHGRNVSLSGPAVYLAAEGLAGLNNRRMAWEKHHGIKMGDNFKVFPQAIDAGSAYWDYFVEYVADVQPVLTVIDTVSQTLGDIAESTEFHKYVRQCDRIRVASGGAVLMLHHENKGGGYRGGTAIKGNVDTLMFLKKEFDDDPIDLYMSKQKDGQQGSKGGFRLKVIEIGKKDDGSPLTSVVWTPARNLNPFERN